MKKCFLILIGFSLFSCKTMNVVEQKSSDLVTLSWQSKEADNFDVYSSDTLLATKIPCLGENTLTIHNYPPGIYKFVFKSNSDVVETLNVRINQK